MAVGRVVRRPVRELFAHEAHSFTVWLSENLDVLGEAVGIRLSLVRREAAAGAFSADILAEDSTGRVVVIENQLEPTDHDHLGKLITYMSNLEAKSAIWVTSQPRPEHETAVHWLNEYLPADTSFYLVRLEAIQIGETSDIAPLFSVVAGPSQAARDVGDEKKELAERHILRRDFWTQLLERARRTNQLHARVGPTTDNWLSAGSGRSGVRYNYVIRMNDAYVELIVDTGNASENKRIFDRLAEQKASIEDAFGSALNWRRLDSKQSSRITYDLPEGGLTDRSHWELIQDGMIEAMTRLERAFKSRVREL